MDHAATRSLRDRPGAGAIRFSTDAYAPQDRVAAWHDIYGRTLLKLDIEPIETAAFHADVVLRKLPGLGMVVGSRSAAIYRRSRERIDNDDVVVSIGLAGSFEATQFGRTAAMARGDAVVVTAAEPGHVAFLASGPALTLCVPARAIAAGDATLCRRIPADNTALRLLTGYVGVLEEADSLASPAMQSHAVTHIHDLLALAIGSTREATEIAQARGARAARLRAIKADIGANLARFDLSVATIAADHRLPVRYVQRLFETEGITFTDFVLDQRLARAHRMLIDPRGAALKIATLAAEAGFSDLSYFNRTFRRRYGASPTDLRAQSRRDN
jgi:AraC-like DNA-binding protein